MDEPRKLDLNCGWEGIVNPHSKQTNDQKQKCNRRWLAIIVAMLCAVLIGMVLWMLKALPGVPAIMVTEICSCIAAFVAGRLWEVGSR